MSGCPHDIPAMRVSKGNVRPTTDVSSGHLMYNTEHNYLEIYHSDSNNPTGWRDLIINNKEQIDISGTVRCDGSMVLIGDLSVNGNIFFSDNLYQNGTLFEGGGGGSGNDASFNVIQEFSDGYGITFLSDVSVNGNVDVVGEIRATSDVISFYSSSDRTLKTNIRTIEKPMEIINNLRGVRFNWNEEAYNINNDVDLSRDEIGVIAQEIQQYLPEVIKPGLNNKMAVRYENIVAVLIEGMHEMQERIQTLENEIRKK